MVATCWYHQKEHQEDTISDSHGIHTTGNAFRGETHTMGGYPRHIIIYIYIGILYAIYPISDGNNIISSSKSLEKPSPEAVHQNGEQHSGGEAWRTTISAALLEVYTSLLTRKLSFSHSIPCRCIKEAFFITSSWLFQASSLPFKPLFH